jgi:hypothetical protein
VKHGPVWAGHAAQQCNPCRASLGRDFLSQECNKRERGRTAARAGWARQAGGSDPPQAKANARISGRLDGLFSGQGCRTAKPVSLGKVWPKDEEFLKVKIYFYCFQ